MGQGGLWWRLLETITGTVLSSILKRVVPRIEEY